MPRPLLPGTVMPPPRKPASALLRLRARLVPEAEGLGWMPFYNLGYLVFLFMPMLLGLLGEQRVAPVANAVLLWPTLASIVAFLPLYFVGYNVHGVRMLLVTLAIAGIGNALMPFNPFANAYTIYAVGFAAMLGGRLGPRLVVASAILAVLLTQIHFLGYPVFVFLVTFIVAVAVFFANHHFLETTRKRAELKLSHDEVRRLAALAERERIGRDLHDLLGHTLSLVALKTDLATRLVERDPAAAKRELEEISRVSRDALAQVRAAVTGIRAAGFAAELASARLLLESGGVTVTTALPPAPAGGIDALALPPGVETALAMVVREAVTNIQRHAQAHSAHVALSTDGGEAVLQIRDDGRGGEIRPGNGLDGMRERIEAIGGVLRVDSRQGEGTRIEVRVPLQGEEGEA